MDLLRGGNIWFFTPLFYECIMAMLCLRCLNHILPCDMSQSALIVDRDDYIFPKDVAMDHVHDLLHIEKLLEINISFIALKLSYSETQSRNCITELALRLDSMSLPC